MPKKEIECYGSNAAGVGEAFARLMISPSFMALRGISCSANTELQKNIDMPALLAEIAREITVLATDKRRANEYLAAQALVLEAVSAGVLERAMHLAERGEHANAQKYLTISMRANDRARHALLAVHGRAPRAYHGAPPEQAQLDLGEPVAARKRPYLTCLSGRQVKS
jgi:hypothetical protein